MRGKPGRKPRCPATAFGWGGAAGSIGHGIFTIILTFDISRVNIYRVYIKVKWIFLLASVYRFS